MPRDKSPDSAAASGADATRCFPSLTGTASTNIPSVSSRSPGREPQQHWLQEKNVNIIKITELDKGTRR